MGDPSLDVIRFLDSLDDYLTLSDSLSLTLRQGWLDLASARHSMGTSRVTSAVFDLKPHPAAATLHVQLEDKSVSDLTAEVEEGSRIISCLRHPSFTLSKECGENGRCLEPEGQKQPNSVGAELRCRVPSRSYVNKKIYPTRYGIHVVLMMCIHSMLLLEDHQKEQSAKNEVQDYLDAQKQRSKLLSVYGVLVSPKLRGAQISFEKALETITNLANARARMVAAFERIEKDTKMDLK